MDNQYPYLDEREIEILNTPLSKLSKEMMNIAFSIRDKIAAQTAEKNKKHIAKQLNIVLQDKDKLLANGIESPITKEKFTNRRQWNNHLKANGCVEVGNDFNKAKMREEVRGDFNCRDELGKAVYQVAEKYGY